VSYLSLNDSLSNLNPQVGEQVEVSINVTDDEGTPYGDCDVALSIANETILAQNQGNEFYNATIDTSGMAGFYNLTIFTRNAPPGFLQGTVTYPLEVGPHDIAVTNVSLSKSSVGLGYELTMNLTLQDDGFFAEAFNVTIYANTTIVATTIDIALSSGNSTTITFTWNTTGFAKGNYTLSAYAWPVPGETDTADNNFAGRWVIVSMVGDLTGTGNAWDFVPDGVVDGSDLSIVAKCYGSWPEAQPPMIWNANCDVNNDGVVDGSDLAIIAKHFGEGGP
jgi:hypothetical protein